MTMDSRVKIVRVFLRQSVAQMSGKVFHRSFPYA